MKKEALEIIDSLKNINPNHPKIYEYWEELTNILSINEVETINFLYECNEDEILQISAVFEEISEILQSHEFIKCLRELDKKFPNANLTDFIDSAKNYID